MEIDRLAMDGDKPAEAASGYGLVGGAPVYAFAQDKAVCSGAVGKAQAAKIAKIYELAAQNGAPIVGFFDSDGAKLGEGLDAMDAIAQLLLSSNNLSGVVPQIAVITGACVGTSALIAATSDLVVMVKDGSYYLSKDDEGGKPDVLARTRRMRWPKQKRCCLICLRTTSRRRLCMKVLRLLWELVPRPGTVPPPWPIPVPFWFFPKAPPV